MHSYITKNHQEPRALMSSYISMHMYNSVAFRGDKCSTACWEVRNVREGKTWEESGKSANQR